MFLFLRERVSRCTWGVGRHLVNSPWLCGSVRGSGVEPSDAASGYVHVCVCLRVWVGWDCVGWLCTQVSCVLCLP